MSRRKISKKKSFNSTRYKLPIFQMSIIKQMRHIKQNGKAKKRCRTLVNLYNRLVLINPGLVDPWYYILEGLEKKIHQIMFSQVKYIKKSLYVCFILFYFWLFIKLSNSKFSSSSNSQKINSGRFNCTLEFLYKGFSFSNFLTFKKRLNNNLIFFK